MAINNTISNQFKFPTTGLVKPPPSSTPSQFTGRTALQSLGIGGGYGFGGKSLFPSNPVTQTPTIQSGGSATSPAQQPVTSNFASPQSQPLAVSPVAQTQTTIAPQAQNQPIKGLFPSVTASLANYGSNNNPTAQKYIADTAKYGAGSIPIAAQARDIAEQFGQKYADVGRAGAKFEAGQLTTGTTPVAEGNAAVTARTTAAQQTALAQGEQAALQGIGYQLTGQQQAAGAANQAAGQAYTGQGQAISALGTAAGLAQPSPAAYGQTVFNPITGQYEGGGGLPPEVMQQYAQMAANGQISSIPSSITGNPVLSAQLNAAAKALNPNYSPITSAAQGSSAADLTGQKSSIQAQANGAEQNFNLMTNIAKQGGVNDTNVPILNTLQNNVKRGLTSSAAVANFQSLIQSVRSQYAAILGGGTVTVEALQEAQSLIPSDISLSALQSLGQNLKSDAQNRIVGIDQQIQSLQGGGGGSSGYNTSGNTGGALSWDNIGD